MPDLLIWRHGNDGVSLATSSGGGDWRVSSFTSAGTLFWQCVRVPGYEEHFLEVHRNREAAMAEAEVREQALVKAVAADRQRGEAERQAGDDEPDDPKPIEQYARVDYSETQIEAGWSTGTPGSGKRR